MDRREFLDILADQIRTRRVRPALRKEMEAHIEDQKQAFMSQGMTDTEAEEAAVREMGDPVETGAALDRIHRPRMEWSVLVCVLLTGLLGLVLQAVVAGAACPGFSVEVMLEPDVLGRQLAATAAGILLMLLICWMDYTFLERYAVPLWMLVNVLLILCAMESPVMNGRPYYLMYAAFLIIPFYAGMLYHFRGQGFGGILKSVLCICIPLAILYFYYMLSVIFIIGLVCMILLHAAIYRKWFGENRRALCLKLWGTAVLAAALLSGVCYVLSGGRILAEYQMDRVRAWLNTGGWLGGKIPLENVAEEGRRMQESMREGFRTTHLDFHYMKEIRSSYMWVYLFHFLGTWRGVLITVLVLGFWVYMFHIVKKQKNEFGYMVSLACVLFLSLQTVMYMGMNAGAVPLGTAYIPFVSGGGAFLVLSYFYMGILLSVCNNSRCCAGTKRFRLYS